MILFSNNFETLLSIKQRIISPTFIIVRSYLVPNNEVGFKDFYHVDLYRLEDNLEKEITNLGLKEVWVDSKNIVVIEWAEKVIKLVPKNAIWMNFRNSGKSIRRIVMGSKYDYLR